MLQKLQYSVIAANCLLTSIKPEMQWLNWFVTQVKISGFQMKR